jgi:hypothetical protein
LIKLLTQILTNLRLEPNEDERRLFYGFNSAKQQVYLTYSERYVSGSYFKEAVPSMFLTEIPKNFRYDEPRLAKAKRSFKPLAGPAQPTLPTVQEADWLKTLVADYKLSATALNTYLTLCYNLN